MKRGDPPENVVGDVSVVTLNALAPFPHTEPVDPAPRVIASVIKVPADATADLPEERVRAGGDMAAVVQMEIFPESCPAVGHKLRKMRAVVFQKSVSDLVRNVCPVQLPFAQAFGK